MALDFFVQDDLLIEEPEYLDCLEIAERIGGLELEEYDKLEPCWELCRQQGILIGGYFSDTLLKSHHVPVVLNNLRSSYGLIAARKPFVHPSEIDKDAYHKMVKILETALARKVGIIAVCD